MSVCLSVCPSVRAEQLGSHWVDFNEISYLCILRKICRKQRKIHKNLSIITGTLHEDQYTFFVISRSFLLTMRNVSNRSYIENQNTRFVFNNLFFYNLPVYETMQKKYIVGPNRSQVTIPRMPIACWMPKATDTQTQTEYVILIAFLLQQWLPERASLLRYTSIACIFHCSCNDISWTQPV
jgi:hypothetical protein